MRSTILLASFLLVIPLISANPSPTRPRRSTPTVPLDILPTSPVFKFSNCFIDSGDTRVLSHLVTPNGPGALTLNGCINACSEQNYVMAGVEDGQFCYCDNAINFSNPNNVDVSECLKPCPGDNSQGCGQTNLIIVYQKANL